MKRLIREMTERLKRLFTQKGQGLVEFVLILAFCAGIGVAAREAGFGKALNSLFDSGERPEYETAAIGSARSIDWGKEVFTGENSTFSEENAAERLAWDQKSLENLAGYFIGKSKTEIKALLGGKSADMGWGEKGEEVVLGHFRPTSDKQGTIFDPESLQAGDAMNIFSWLKGIYDTTSGADNPNYDPEYRYFVSDYAISQGWADKAGNNQAIGIRIALEYDRSDLTVANENLKVIGVNIAIDPKSQYGLFTDRHSLGLNVQIRSDGTVTYNNTGRLFDQDVKPLDGWSNASTGMQIWYGDDATVKQFIIDNALTVINGEMVLARGSIVTENDKYYVVLADGTYNFNNSSVSDQVASGSFVEIADTFYHANANYIANTVIQPGDIVIKGVAQAYVYTDVNTTNKKYKDIPESSWLQITGN